MDTVLYVCTVTRDTHKPKQRRYRNGERIFPQNRHKNIYYSISTLFPLYSFPCTFAHRPTYTHRNSHSLITSGFIFVCHNAKEAIKQRINAVITASVMCDRNFFFFCCCCKKVWKYEETAVFLCVIGHIYIHTHTHRHISAYQ